jgi:UDP-N-acetylglucosamine:LPS N-acetylglucosamine transferase
VPRVAIISASVGAGHDGVARELSHRLRSRGIEVQSHDFLDFLPYRLGAQLRRTYAAELNLVPGTWGALLAALNRKGPGTAMANFAAKITASRALGVLRPAPDVVVSTYPLASQMLSHLRRTGQLNVPVLTYLTDMSVHRLWVAPHIDLHLALHPEPAAQAAALGARTRVISPAVATRFRPAAHGLRERRYFGLPVDTPIALIVGGSWGVGALESTMEDVAATGVALPVVLCGTDIAKRDRLAMRGLGPALGWVDEMDRLLRASDVVVQNAGGLTSLEALASGVPVVSYRCVSGHGITNAAALDRAGYAPWVRKRAELGPALLAAMQQPAPRLLGETDPADVISAYLDLREPLPVAS